MNNETISVVLPVWKPNLDQLKQCLDSLVNQTYDDLEIIIVYRRFPEFDKSFYSLIEEYHDDKRVQVVEGKNPGFVNSLNEGVQNSSSNYIGRIDGDDYCEINRFEKQMEFKKQTRSHVVGSWAHLISNDGKIIGKLELPIIHDEIRKKMMLHCPMLHPSLLMNKKMLLDIGLYDPAFRHAEDYELYFRAMYHNYKFANVPSYLVYLRENMGSRVRGVEWRMQRSYYIKAKNKAFFHYGFRKYYDVFYHLFTPLAYFVSPDISLRVKSVTGWYKNN